MAQAPLRWTSTPCDRHELTVATHEWKGVSSRLAPSSVATAGDAGDDYPSPWTGIRQCELFGLQWDDVDDAELTVRHSRTLDGSLGLPKNGRGRTIPVQPPPRVLETCRDDPTHSSFTRPGVSRF